MKSTISKAADTSSNAYEQVYLCIIEDDPDRKLALTREIASDWKSGLLTRQVAPCHEISLPGLPAGLKLVAPKDLPRRKLNSAEGIAALIHSLCHIEYNAINLAWDAVYRFREMPDQYYLDWIKVAEEEAYHFALLREHLRHLGYDYGDFSAHNGLWEMCVDTAHDVMVRMALVPRVLEARGLDVTPGIKQKLVQAGDENAADLLNIIERDEVGHVAIGSRWFEYMCLQRNLAAQETFRELLNQYMKGGIRKPLAREARIKAGFTEAELDYLEGVGE